MGCLLCAVRARSSPSGAPSPARLPLWAKLRQEPRLLRQCLRGAPCAFADLLPLRVRGSLSPCPRPEEGLRRAAEGTGETRAGGRAPALEENPGGVSEVEGGPAAGPPEERDGLSTGPGPASLSLPAQPPTEALSPVCCSKSVQTDLLEL